MAPDARGVVSYGGGSTAEELNDTDGEFEIDSEVLQTAPQSHADAQSRAGEGSDRDAEGEEVDMDAEGESDDEVETVGAVKVPAAEAEAEELSSAEEEDAKDVDAAVEYDVESKSAASDVSSGTNSDISESDVEEEWEAESDTTKDAQETASDAKICIHCKQTEDNDPAPEFEEFLGCAVCGDGAHRQCARDANTLQSDEDADSWRCFTCVENGLEADSPSDNEETPRRESVPKIARDLLATDRGGDDGEGHSVFEDLILPDDPLDGSRALRKRKSSPEEEDGPSVRSTRKRRRASTAASGSTRRPSDPATPRTRSGAAAKEKHDSDDEHAPSPRTRSTRPRRSAPQRHKPGASIIHNEGMGLVVCIKVHEKDELAKILASRPRKKRVRDRSRKIQAPYEEPEVSHYPGIDTNYMPFLAFGEREDESKLKPYGGILSEADADTSKTFPQAIDRKRFEDARQKAEEDWKRKLAANPAPPEPSRSASKMSGPPSKIKCINFGGWEIETWHAAPYPEEYSRNKVLYICEFCLKYMNSDYVAWRHKLKCPAKHPPGDEIYRDGRFSFFEVDGRKNPVYCQNLCLLAKLFLGSKTLYYDVEPFLFYVMTENNEFGCHFVGYFSKEKRPSSLNNVSCILVLPIHQRKGFGHMLIEFSYLLTRVEQKTGSPEKPLSDMGLVSYRNYWRLILCYQLINQKKPVGITQLSERTGMTADDLVSALEGLRALVRDPITKTYALRLDTAFFKQYIAKHEAKNWPKINPKALVWTPYVMGRGALSSYDEGPQLHTVAPREEETNEDAVAEEGVQMLAAATKAAEAAAGDGKLTAGSMDDEASGPKPEDNVDLVKNSHPSTPAPVPNGVPRTPVQANSTATPASIISDIPPSRFEVFPPIPGMPSTKRRPGRPFGSRRRPATPLRRNHTAPGGKNLTLLSQQDKSPIGLGINGSTSRRTRSKLGEMVNGVGSERDEDAIANGSPRKSLRSQRNALLKEGIVPRNEHGEEDGDGEEDEDAPHEDDDDEDDGELRLREAEEEDQDEDEDEDAEGEPDDDAIMADG